MDDIPEPAADEAPAATRRGRHYRGRHRRLRRWPRRMLIAANVVVLLLIASSATAVGYLTYEYKQIKHVSITDLTPVSTTVPTKTKTKTVYRMRNHHRVKVKIKVNVKAKAKAPGKPPFTVLIIGSDSRADAAKLGDDVGNVATQSENLSDAIILARVSPSTHQVALLSIPRDLVVNVPGIGDTKINAAFAGGDPTRLVQVIQTDIGIPVNHYAALNFLAVEEIANAIGGVEQYFPTPAQDLYSNLSVAKAGCVNLTGAQALAFVRSRHYQYFLDGEWQYQGQPESDLGRIQRQQAFIRDGVEKVERTGALSNPLTLKSIISSVAKNLTLDQTFSVSDLLSLADAFQHIDATKIPSVTLSAVNAVEDGADVLLPSPAADAAEIKTFLATGTPTVKKATTPKPTTTTTSTPTSTTVTTLPHSGISVEVENGSGTANQATTASDDLEQAGFVVSGSQDAATFDYVANVVEYGSGGRPAAKTLRAALEGGATLTRDPALSGSDLILITGSSFTGVAASTESGSTTTTTTVPTTTTTAPVDGSPYQSATAVIPSSSTYVDNGVYIPPGRVPGQKISTCGN
jgi:LCP family protein required for cell wall assembly